MSTARRPFLTIRSLPPALRPAHVYRGDTTMIVAWHNGATRRQIAEATTFLLTPQEMDAYRAAFGHPPIGQPAPDWCFTDGPIIHWVPPVLRTAGAPAVQGLDLPDEILAAYERYVVANFFPSLQEAA